jgi:beta-1,2-mannobiose phosphorylase / 1,2-beta-oligomannan phosphorylase
MPAPILLERYSGNPILSPHPDHPWEDLAVFNPAAWQDAASGEVRMLYRAAESGPEYKCWFGLARSRDGYHFERVSTEPALSPSIEGFDGATIQDPRVIQMGDWFYVTYACRHFPFGQFWTPEVRTRFVNPDCPPEFPRYLRTNATLSGLALTRDFRRWIRAGWLTDPLLDDRDVILFPEKIGGKFWMIHRPLEWVGREFGTEQACAWIKSAQDLLGMPAAPSRLLLRNQHGWESLKLGVNTPPIRTPEGWFTLYHAVGADKHYRLGAVLLDLEDPSIVRYRTRDWLMQPEADYELNGFYPGVCFPCGTVVLDGRLHVYYGGADKFCALATCDFGALLEYLRRCPACV